MSFSPSDEAARAIAPPADIAAALAHASPRLGPFGSLVHFFSSVGSTNDIAAALADAGAREGATVVAEAQTAGRGRRGRVWHSPSGAGLYVSVVFRPEVVDAAAPPAYGLTLMAGVAVAEGVHASTGLAVELEWPNDVVIGRRKLAGILAEASSAGARPAVVVGFGVNVRAAAYPPDLARIATSIETELGRAVDRGAVLAEILAALAARRADLAAGRFDAILNAWRQRAPRTEGAPVEWADQSGVRRGVTAGVDRDGALLVRIGNRVERVLSGEIGWL